MSSKWIILIIVLIQSLYGQFYNHQNKVSLSSNVHDQSQSSPLNFSYLKDLHFSNDIVKQIQYIDPFNVCIIVTQKKFLVWDLILSDVITEHSYQQNEIEENIIISFNLLVEDSTLSKGKSVYLVMHQSNTKQIMIFKYKIDAFLTYNNTVYYLLPQGQVHENGNILDQYRIEVIEELGPIQIKSAKQLKSQMIVQLSDSSFRYLIASPEITINESTNCNTNCFSFKAQFQNQSVRRIYPYSNYTYIFIIGDQNLMYFVSAKESLNEMEFSQSILSNLEILKIGSLPNKNYKYIAYTSDYKLSIAFLRSNSNSIFQMVDYSSYTLFPSFTRSDSLYIQSKETNQVDAIQFMCQQYICTESSSNRVALPANSIMLISKRSIKETIFISQDQNLLKAGHFSCEILNQVFSINNFTCVEKENCLIFNTKNICLNSSIQRQLQFDDERQLGDISYESTTNTSIKTTSTSTDTTSEDDSQSDALQIVQIVLGVVGAIVILFIVVLCIRKHRQRQFKRQKQKEEEEANKAAALNNNQGYFQPNNQQYLQLPNGSSNADNSNYANQQRGGSNASRQIPVGAGNIPSNLNNQFSQGVPSPQRVPSSIPSNFQNLSFQQQLSAQQHQPINGMNGIVNPGMPGVMMIKNDLPGQQYQVPMIPQNIAADPEIALRQKQLLMMEMDLRQKELQMREDQLQRQQQGFQLPPDPYNQINNMPPYQDYGNNLNNNINNNVINIYDNEIQRPQSDYQKLAAQMEQKQQVKQINGHNKQNGKLNETTPTPIDDIQFKQMNYEPLPPMPAPPVQNIEVQNVQKAPFNFSIPNGYFYNLNPQQQKIFKQSLNNYLKQSQQNNLNNTEIQKNNFEQQMMALMASGALPQDFGKNHDFIQPPIVEEGEQDPDDKMEQPLHQQKQHFNVNQSQSIKLNNDISNTQVQKQKFEDEMLRQLQGTEVFQKNKQMQNQQQLPPIEEKEFPKFIHDQEEQPDNLHKFEDEEEEYDDANHNDDDENNIDENVNKINQIVFKQCNPQIPHPSQIKPVNGQGHKSNVINHKPHNHLNGNEHELEQSDPNVFLAQLRDQLGQSLGQNKPDRKFIESQVEPPPLYSEFKNNKKQDEAIDINQISLAQVGNQKYQDIKDKIPQKGNYQNIMQDTDNGYSNQINGQPNMNNIIDENAENKITCKICLDQPPQVAFQCGHTLCEACSIRIQKQNNICPLCFVPILSTMKVFI